MVGESGQNGDIVAVSPWRDMRLGVKRKLQRMALREQVEKRGNHRGEAYVPPAEGSGEQAWDSCFLRKVS